MKILKLSVKQRSIFSGYLHFASNNDCATHQVKEFVSIGFGEIPLGIETPNYGILDSWRHDDLVVKSNIK